MSKFLDRYVWWHRIRRHEVASAGVCDMFGSIGTGCLTCDIKWVRGLHGDIDVFMPPSRLT